jgi:hypothetical protein
MWGFRTGDTLMDKAQVRTNASFLPFQVIIWTVVNWHSSEVIETLDGRSQ